MNPSITANKQGKPVLNATSKSLFVFILNIPCANNLPPNSSELVVGNEFKQTHEERAVAIGLIRKSVHLTIFFFGALKTELFHIELQSSSVKDNKESPIVIISHF